MERVTGIGGVFFKAQQPEKLSEWYEKHLGIAAKDCMADFTWRDKDDPKKIGRTVWCVFPKDTSHFDSAAMLNYRVANLDRMLEQLRAAGITVEKVEDHDYGRFAWFKDPEGNRIELWEPKGE